MICCSENHCSVLRYSAVFLLLEPIVIAVELVAAMTSGVIILALSILENILTH